MKSVVLKLSFLDMFAQIMLYILFSEIISKVLSDFLFSVTRLLLLNELFFHNAATMFENLYLSMLNQFQIIIYTKTY